MQSTSDFSTDPILRRIEQDMAPNSGASSPQRDAPSPAPSSTISSLFSKAMSFGGGTPTGTPKNIVPSSVGGRPGYRQSSLFERTGSVLGRPFTNLLSPHTESGSRYTSHQLPRQRSLESSESVSPCGSGHTMGGVSRYRGQLIRRRSEGGEDAGSYMNDIGDSIMGSYPEYQPSSALRTTMLGGPQMPHFSIQNSQPQRYRPPFNRTGGIPPPRGGGRGMRSRPPFLSRGRSMDTPTSHITPYSPSLQPSASTQQDSNLSNQISSVTSSGVVTYTIPSNLSSGITTSTIGNEFPSQRQYSGRIQTDYMSAPEGGGWGSGYESTGGVDANKTISSLYPRVHITADNGTFGRKDLQKESLSSYEGGVVSSTSVPITSSTTNFTTNTAYSGLGRSSLVDPRSAVHPTASNAVLNTPGPFGTNTTPGSSGGVTRRKLDSTFRTDSLSSDQSDTRVRPPPPKPHKPKRRTQVTSNTNINRAQTFDATSTSVATLGPIASGTAEAMKALSGSGRSRASGSSGRGKAFGASSSDDEIRSTDFTSCGEEEMESESVSEKGKLTSSFET